MDRRAYLKTVAAGTVGGSILLNGCDAPAEQTANKIMKSNGPISKRGVLASQTPGRVDMDAYFEAEADMYHPVNNPKGKFPLNVAENRLTWPLLKAQIAKVSNEVPLADWVANYTSSLGALSTRQVMASFMEKFLTGCAIDPDHLCLGPGAGSVIDMTCWIIGEPGDVAVIPAPCYPVYKQDIGGRPGMERYDLVTHHEMSEIHGGPLLTVDHLEKAKKDIESQGKRFRLLIITNPDNPTGGIFSREKLEAFADWCLANEVHMVVNEIYGLSMIDTKHPLLRDDYSGDVPFYSFANIMLAKKSDYLHHWYALSKDFGVSGFRVGMMHTWNKTLIAAYNNLNPPSMVSNYAQWIFEQVLADDEFVKKYVTASQKALTENYAAAVSVLRELKIPYSPARGSLFVWMDFSEFLKENTQEAETAFWSEMFKATGVLVTPGNGFGNSKKGQFRLVYSYVNKDGITAAMSKLAEFVKGRRG